MRGIQNDLRERLAAVIAQLLDVRTEYDHDRNDLERRFNERFTALSDERSSLEIILASESRRQGEDQAIHQKPKERSLIPTALNLDLRPISGCNCGYDLGFGHQGIPGVAASFKDRRVGVPDAVAETIAAQIVPDVFD
jgi:hypothetical protein